jgi:hypothetical protein
LEGLRRDVGMAISKYFQNPRSCPDAAKGTQGESLEPQPRGDRPE